MNPVFMDEKPRDIEERAFQFACEIVRFCDREYASGGVLRRLLTQLVDASTSIGSNLEEAAVGQSRQDFIAKACIARKEAREARYWLRIIVACYERHRPVLLPLLKESHEILNVVSAIVKNARANLRREKEARARTRSRGEIDGVNAQDRREHRE